MGVSGVFREVVVPERIVSTEKFAESWYPGEALVTNVFHEHGGKTTCTITMRYESTEARDAVLASPMEMGVGAGCKQLDELLVSLG
jgi:uncharacterized protein YndB with AHSA1/START domain